MPETEYLPNDAVAWLTVSLCDRNVPDHLPRRSSFVRFPVLAAASMKFRFFWDVAPCSHVKIDRRFRGAYCGGRRLNLKLVRVYNEQSNNRDATQNLLNKVTEAWNRKQTRWIGKHCSLVFVGTVGSTEFFSLGIFSQYTRDDIVWNDHYNLRSFWATCKIRIKMGFKYMESYFSSITTLKLRHSLFKFLQSLTMLMFSACNKVH
jgi:hypothetical protein